MSRRPTVLDTFSILEDHWNSNFVGVDVNGRTSQFVDASYRHPQTHLARIYNQQVSLLILKFLIAS